MAPVAPLDGSSGLMGVICEAAYQQSSPELQSQGAKQVRAHRYEEPWATRNPLLVITCLLKLHALKELRTVVQQGLDR